MVKECRRRVESVLDVARSAICRQMSRHGTTAIIARKLQHCSQVHDKIVIGPICLTSIANIPSFFCFFNFNTPNTGPTVRLALSRVARELAVWRSITTQHPDTSSCAAGLKLNYNRLAVRASKVHTANIPPCTINTCVVTCTKRLMSGEPRISPKCIPTIHTNLYGDPFLGPRREDMYYRNTRLTNVPKSAATTPNSRSVYQGDLRIGLIQTFLLDPPPLKAGCKSYANTFRKTRIRRLLLAIKGLDRRVDELTVKAALFRKKKINSSKTTSPLKLLSVIHTWDTSLCNLSSNKDKNDDSLSHDGTTSHQVTTASVNSDSAGASRDVCLNTIAAAFVTPRLVCSSLSVVDRIVEELGKAEDIIPKRIALASRDVYVPHERTFQFPSLLVNETKSTQKCSSPTTQSSIQDPFPLQLLPNTTSRTCKLKARTAPFDLSSLNFHLQLVSEVQWLNAIAESHLELAKFESQRVVVQARQERGTSLAFDVSESKVRWQRVELAKQRATYEAALYEALSEHPAVAADTQFPPGCKELEQAPRIQFDLQSASDNSHVTAPMISLSLKEPVSSRPITPPPKLISPLAPTPHKTRSWKDSTATASSQLEDLPQTVTKTGKSILFASVTVLLSSLRDLDTRVHRHAESIFLKEDHIMHSSNSMSSSEILMARVTADPVKKIKNAVICRDEFLSPAAENRATASIVNGQVDYMHSATKTTRSIIVPNSEPVIYRVGDRVEAQFDRGRAWFFGRVTRLYVEVNAYDVEYDDDDVDVALPERFIRVPFAIATQNIGTSNACITPCEARYVECNSTGARMYDTAHKNTAGFLSITPIKDSDAAEDYSFDGIEGDLISNKRRKQVVFPAVLRAIKTPSTPSFNISQVIAIVAPSRICFTRTVLISHEEDHSEECPIPDSCVQLLNSQRISLHMPRTNGNRLRPEKASTGNVPPCIKEKEQNQLNAIDRRLALKSLQEELQRELDVTDACIESAKKHLDDLRTAEAIATDKISRYHQSPDDVLQHHQKKVPCNAKMFPKKIIELLGCDHVELAEECSVYNKVYIGENYLDLNSFASEKSYLSDVFSEVVADTVVGSTVEGSDACSLSIDNQSTFDTHITFSISELHTDNVSILLEKKQWQRNENILAITIQPLIRGRLLRKQCSSTKLLENSGCHLYTRRSLTCFSEMNQNAQTQGFIYNHIEAVEPAISLTVPIRPMINVSLSTTFAGGVYIISDAIANQNVHETSSTVRYDCIEVAEPARTGIQKQLPVFTNTALDDYNQVLDSTCAYMGIHPNLSVLIAKCASPPKLAPSLFLNGYDTVEKVAVFTRAKHGAKDEDALLEGICTCAEALDTLAGGVLRRLIWESIVAVTYPTLKGIGRISTLIVPDGDRALVTSYEMNVLNTPESLAFPNNTEPSACVLEQYPRDWSDAVAAYAMWLASNGEILLRSLKGGDTSTSENNASAQLELFIDTEQRCDASAIKFSVKPSNNSNLPLTGGTREQAQIHRHAVFDALSEVITGTYYNHDDSTAGTLLSNWFKHSFESGRSIQTGPKIIVDAAATLLNSKSDSKDASVLNAVCTRGLELERDICMGFANKILNNQLRMVLQTFATAKAHK